MKILRVIQLILLLVSTGPVIAADLAHGAGVIQSEFPGKPQAPVVLHWSSGANEGQLEASLTPLLDFDEIRVALHIPGDNRPHETWRFQNGRRGETLAVSWHGVSQSGLPRLLVKMWSDNRLTTRTLAQPLDSERAFKSWQRESRRLEFRRRMNKESRLVILPVKDSPKQP